MGVHAIHLYFLLKINQQFNITVDPEHSTDLHDGAEKYQKGAAVVVN